METVPSGSVHHLRNLNTFVLVVEFQPFDISYPTVTEMKATAVLSHPARKEATPGRTWPTWRQEGLTVLLDERYSSFGTPTKLIGRYLNKAGQINGFYKIEAV